MKNSHSMDIYNYSVFAYSIPLAACDGSPAALKNGTGKFVWTDAKGNVISVGTPNENGDVTGPSAIGSYRLVFQTLQKGENGMEWAEKAVLHCFEITDPNEIN